VIVACIRTIPRSYCVSTENDWKLVVLTCCLNPSPLRLIRLIPIKRTLPPIRGLQPFSKDSNDNTLAAMLDDRNKMSSPRWIILFIVIQNGGDDVSCKRFIPRTTQLLTRKQLSGFLSSYSAGFLTQYHCHQQQFPPEPPSTGRSNKMIYIY